MMGALGEEAGAYGLHFGRGRRQVWHRDFLAKAGNLFHVRTVQVNTADAFFQ